MQNLLRMSPESRAAFVRLRGRHAEKLADRFEPRDADMFWLRIERWFEDARRPILALYGDRDDAVAQADAIFDCVVDGYLARPESLRLLDLERQLTPDWFERPDMIGYVLYPQRFAGALRDVQDRLDYLQELHISYLHIMSLLKPRPGENDGGYAIMDYRSIAPELGTLEDLRALTSALHGRGIALCADLVLNHTAAEHDWAERARSGDPKYLAYYHTFSDRELPDAFERSLPEVFPDEAPGNFTFVPDMADHGRWVWTTFNRFQWDLNYSNPAVFREMLAIMCFLVNQGVDVLRLDAAPFLWKRMGTDCQNQPEVQLLIEAYRALMRVVAPGVIFKAEAIVPPDDLLRYIGVDANAGKRCELAYNNQFMVNLWSGLATRKATLATAAMHMAPRLLLGATAIHYVRCHDDIGWGMSDETLREIGEDPTAHRHFLNDFYTGRFPGSFARGAYFQFDPASGDARISGTTASLAGLERAIEIGDPAEIDLAVSRILLLYGLILGRAGIPLIYMGDEIGMLNDPSYRDDPEQAHDSRWLHRPRMDWTKAERRHDPRSLEGRLFEGIKRLIEARRSHPHTHNFGLLHPLWSDNVHVLAFARHRNDGHLLVLANFSEDPQSVQGDLPRHAGLTGELTDLIDGNPSTDASGRIQLPPYGLQWLVGNGRL
ncbi:alpha-amylase family glycosyl hydrolase [Thiocapsa rosea]|uniref:Amylosucrase n=1 Tax=Thiocapsa rosea TaxID=69360 RepID=A0A495VFI1_9GAMM|nr:alpha-amylase family glycosyl hydrolase [Thiocapsa rosea]RKT47343.1 amylosucrase [Thiocapsa rosea]